MKEFLRGRAWLPRAAASLLLFVSILLASGVTATPAAAQIVPQGEHAQVDGKDPEPPNMDDYDPGLYAVFDTYMGFIVAKLFEFDAPQTVINFSMLASGRRPWRDPKEKDFVMRPLYENITFHRVIPFFMIQSGDPTGVGNHNCGFVIEDEFRDDLKFDQPGRLAMANLLAPGTASCQFFITEIADENMNGKYTIFGQVLEGMDVVKRISRVVVDAKDKPAHPIALNKVHIIRIVPKQKK